MKALLLAQGDSESTRNIINAFNRREHDLTTIYYHKNFSKGGAPTASITEGGFSFGGQIIDPSDYEIAMLRSWGTAAYGASLLAECEKAGVTVLTRTKDTKVMNSKIASAKLFMEKGTPFPNTVLFENGADASEAFNKASKKLGKIMVFKADYGTRGSGIRFIKTPEDLVKAQAELPVDNPGFLLQELIGAPDRPISHYRVLVGDGVVTNQAIKFTAPKALFPSNGSQGATQKTVISPGEMKLAAQEAAEASNLIFSGVDLVHRDGVDDYLTLEVNDSPATNRFDDIGKEASQACVMHLETRRKQDLGLE